MRRSTIGILLGLALLTALAYARAPQLGFISMDDPVYVALNPNVQAGLSWSGVRWAFTTMAASNWHPLTWLSLMADASIGGKEPGVYHVTNVVLHILATLALFLVFDRATRARTASAIVAALFAIHPLHVESVAWVAERKDVLSALFWMLTLGAYVGYGARPTPRRYALVVLAFAAGLLAKPMLVTLPLVLLLFDLWPLRRWGSVSPRRLLLEKAPLLALSAASAWMTVVAQRPSTRTFTSFPLDERLLNAITSYAAYVGKIFWPTRLAFYYPHPHDALAMWKPALAGAVLIAVTVAAVRLVRTHPWFLVGWGWYLVTLIPVIGIVQVGAQAMADRYTYLPSIGIFVIVAWGAAALVEKKPLLLRTASAAIVVTLAALTWVQVGYWKSSTDLYRHTVDVTENNAVAHAALASALTREGKREEGMEQLRLALKASPEYADMHFQLTRAAIASGKLKEAEFMVGLELDTRPRDVRTLVNAGFLEMQLQRYDRAAARFEEALGVDPDSVDAHLNLGSIRRAEGRIDEAIAHFSAVLRIEPNDPDATRALDELRRLPLPSRPPGERE